MTVTKNERLSALVDSEAEGFEVRRLLDELARNEQDMALWERYHLIGDAVRGGLNHAARPGFADAVMARIADEAESVPAVGRRLVKPVAGVAMAASVAVAVLVGVVNLTGGEDTVAPAVAEAESTVAPPAPRATPAADAGPVIASSTSRNRPAMEPLEASDARIHSFIVNHAEHGAGRGLMPYVRVVGYETPAE
ncbi:sigma-E factor negative regulatory protein [Thioalkalivibrio thiocyanodenitrificans]|uniref:sigma-E factor negative regulatory protein n=1 Tax=Thioalkalivibrio thiocyanodenitrificans TaxID=243063 RepID=UPI000360A6B1|nr:sigma-E factor negative regulatory protein [Thioalkalivibrio thiocyanodenitrificans]